MSRMKKSIKSIGRFFLLFIISLMIGLRMYYWNSSSLVGNSMPMPFGYGASVVLSGSMEPALSVNDVVIVKPLSTT